MLRGRTGESLAHHRLRRGIVGRGSAMLAGPTSWKQQTHGLAASQHQSLKSFNKSGESFSWFVLRPRIVFAQVGCPRFTHHRLNAASVRNARRACPSPLQILNITLTNLLMSMEQHSSSEALIHLSQGTGFVRIRTGLMNSHETSYGSVRASEISWVWGTQPTS